MTGLHVFDMDGTLLHGAASVELSRHLGTFDEASAIEAGWLRGEISDTSFWEQMLPLWSAATESEIDAAFNNAAWINGVEDVFADIARRGEYSIVISQSPHFFVDRLRQWGAHRAYGSLVDPHMSTDRWVLLTPQHKVDITQSVLAELDVCESRCVAYGDSTSDVLLFEHLDNTVGVNCTAAVRSSATVLYDGDDIREAYALGRNLWEQAPTTCSESAS
ncbi:phosphoserine phosphatase [Pseudonocardia ammonioxydans]|uniref:Phosphoserine phosphatase n=1 Tax=Pseudonocardia ammonioxydans TaxID=260086 RepID=A0A1I5HF03_PSUAM|nr:HAD-IB family phosphatase [Pseudonocardia ammonioxydans]SFO46630.1 phosphoserine phosphatase [Pseudonocardia ammonioxydans]